MDRKGRADLHEKGCEYGRNLYMRVENLENWQDDRVEREAKLERRLRQVETSIAKQSGKYIVGGMVLASLVGAVIAKI